MNRILYDSDSLNLLERSFRPKLWLSLHKVKNNPSFSDNFLMSFEFSALFITYWRFIRYQKCQKTRKSNVCNSCFIFEHIFQFPFYRTSSFPNDGFWSSDVCWSLCSFISAFTLLIVYSFYFSFSLNMSSSVAITNISIPETPIWKKIYFFIYTKIISFGYTVEYFSDKIIKEVEPAKWNVFHQTPVPFTLQFIGVNEDYKECDPFKIEIKTRNQSKSAQWWSEQKSN